MKKIAVILLVAFTIATLICACENLGAGNSGTSREVSLTSIYEAPCRNITSSETLNETRANNTTSYRPSIENRISGSRCLNLIYILENGNYSIRIRGWKFNMPLKNENLMQHNQPVFRRERPDQLPPSMVREEAVRKGIPDREEFNNFMEGQVLRQENMTSHFQTYVTPDVEAVNSYLEENGLDDIYEIYEAALTWTWVSDETLNNAEEKWLTPTEFLEETLAYSSNPVYGEPASDCEEQANAFASLLIASGQYNESTVRVAIGRVDFGEISGGHAWVEVYEDGEWFPLDPTDGPYYDDETTKLMPAGSDTDYEKYKNNIYPAVQVWYYYNNVYFINFGTRTGNAPVSWSKEPTSYRKTR